MKKILFSLFFILSVVSTNAQNSHDYLKYQSNVTNIKCSLERRERIEKGNYNTAFGLSVGYSSENYLKLSGKIGGRKMGFVIDGGIMTLLPKQINQNIILEYYNNFTFNVGLTFNILPNFYMGILSGVNHIRQDEFDGDNDTITILDDNYFNCGIVLGCVIKGVDLSVSYSKTEQFSLQIGFLFRD